MEVLAPIVGAVVGVSALGFVANKITERLVKWFSFLHGDWITGASIAAGWGLAFLFPGIDPTEAINAAAGSPLTDLPYWAVRLAAGIFIAIAAAVINDRTEARTGAVVVPGEGQVTRAQQFDEGYVNGVRTPVQGEPGYKG